MIKSKLDADMKEEDGKKKKERKPDERGQGRGGVRWEG